MFQYIVDHWKGNFSFKKSFFINYVCVNLIFNLPTRALFFYLFEQKKELVLAYVLLNIQIAAVCLTCWQAVGVWRSLLKHYPKKDRTFLRLLAGNLPFVSFIFALLSLALLLNGQATPVLRKPVPTPPL